MEGVAASSYKGLKGYFKRKEYKRLDGSSGHRRLRNRVELASMGGAGSSRPRRRFFRFKIKPKLRLFKLTSPKKFFVKLRDAYVKMMLSFANSTVFASGIGGGADGGAAALGYGGGSLGKGHLKEYDEKALVEFYTSLMLQGKLLPLETSRPAGEVVSRR